MSDDYCYRCDFNHDRTQTCSEARVERHRGYAEECKRIAAESRRVEDTRAVIEFWTRDA